jgi:hypothetical protein
MKLFESYDDALRGFAGTFTIRANWNSEGYYLEAYRKARNGSAGVSHLGAIYIELPRHNGELTLDQARIIIEQLYKQVEFFETFNKVIEYNDSKGNEDGQGN